VLDRKREGEWHHPGAVTPVSVLGWFSSLFRLPGEFVAPADPTIKPKKDDLPPLLEPLPSLQRKQRP
jgi:hypothetical protein